MALKKGLGKGLGALIPSGEDNPVPGPDNGKSGIIEIDINNIEPNKHQPRSYFDEEALTALAESLKEYGVIQPLILKEEAGYYSIIAGERRWRAARIAKLATVPAVIKEYNDGEILQIALIENLQREDLNPIEEALCYKRLAEEYFFTQEDIAAKVGKSRNSISYSLSLLLLDRRVREMLAEGKFTAGHGRYLLPIKDGDAQFQMAEKIIDNELSVRETEKQVKELLAPPKLNARTPLPPDPVRSLVFNTAESELKSILGTNVKIRDKKNRGKIEIEYYSDDELDRLLGLFKQI